MCNGAKALLLIGNAPRGREIFEKLAQRYKDNIPSSYDTSINQNLHRVRNLRYVVDVLFTTPEYVVTDVHLADGLSDHCAIVAMISRF